MNLLNLAWWIVTLLAAVVLATYATSSDQFALAIGFIAGVTLMRSAARWVHRLSLREAVRSLNLPACSACGRARPSYVGKLRSVHGALIVECYCGSTYLVDGDSFFSLDEHLNKEIYASRQKSGEWVCAASDGIGKTERMA